VPSLSATRFLRAQDSQESLDTRCERDILSTRALKKWLKAPYRMDDLFEVDSPGSQAG